MRTTNASTKNEQPQTASDTQYSARDRGKGNGTDIVGEGTRDLESLDILDMH